MHAQCHMMFGTYVVVSCVSNEALVLCVGYNYKQELQSSHFYTGEKPSSLYRRS